MLKGGTTLLFVSHSEEQVRQLCNKAALLSHGELVYFGDTDEAYKAYKNILSEE